jgi:hypothetical protein
MCGTCDKYEGEEKCSKCIHEERGYLEDMVIDGRVMLKWILKNLGVRVWSG